MLLRPFVATRGLAVHVPVTVWAKTAISSLNVSVLVLNNLVLVLGDWEARVLHGVVNWKWLPVAVVSSPSALVSLLTGWWWWRGR